ncbi:MAG: MFS transporter [Planctomycetota bacterium]
MRPGERRRGLRFMIVEAMCTQAHASFTGLGAGMAGAPNAVTVGFAILLGAKDHALGLVAALPVAANFFQFLAAALAPRLAGRRGLIMLATLLARVSWLAIGWMPFLLRGHANLALTAFLVFWAISNAALAVGGNLWMSWMADLCPAKIRGRYFSRHAFYTMIVGILAPFLVSVLLDKGFGGVPQKAADGTPLAFLQSFGFAVMFTIAAVFGMLAWAVLRAQPEPGRHAKSAAPPLGLSWFVEPFRDVTFRPLIFFVVVFGATNGLANPFWASFQLEQLKLPYSYVSGIFVAVQGIVTALSLPFWGKVSDRYGNRAVVSMTLGLLFFSPIFYVLASGPAHWWLMCLDAAVQGVGWAGYNVAIFNLVLALTPERKRELYFAAYVTALGTAQAITSVLAGTCLSALPETAVVAGLALHPRQQIFLFTAGARLFCLLFFLKALGPPQNARARAFVVRLRRVLGRPEVQPEERPLVPSEA